jgi:mannosyltransferase
MEIDAEGRKAGSIAVDERPHPPLRARGLGQVPRSLLLAVGLGLVLRLLFLGSKSLWLDEAWSVRVALGDVGSLWSGVADRMNPPGYYLLLMPWVRLDQGEFWLRLPSVLFGVAAIPLIYHVGRLLHSEAVGASAAWLLSVSPIHVWYSQEARGYVLLIVLALGSTIALIQALRRLDGKAWVAHAGLTAAAFYIHYSAVWILLFQALLVVLEISRTGMPFRRISATAVSLLLAGLVFLPWLTSPAAGAFFARVSIGGLYPAQFLAARLGISSGLALLLILAALAFISAALLFGAYLAVRYRHRLESLMDPRRFGSGAFVLMLVALAASVVPRAYSVKRFSMIPWTFGLVALAWAFPLRLPLPRTLRALLVLSLLLSVVNVTLVPKDQWREAVQFVHAHQQPGDVTWLLSAYLRAPYLYYDGGRSEWTGVSPEMTDDELEAALPPSRRVWLVYQTVDQQIIDPAGRVEQWLQLHATPSDMLNVFRVRVRLWTAEANPGRSIDG